MLLNEVKPETKVSVKGISGGLPVKKYLQDLGIKEGVDLKVLSRNFQKPTGAISLGIEGGKVVVPRGWGNAVFVKKGGKTLSLPRLEREEEGRVKSIEKRGRSSLKNFLSLIGVNEGEEITFLQVLPEKILVFELEGKKVKLREGQASKILVDYEEETIQSNYLQEGEEGEISKVLAGDRLREKLDEMGVKEGRRIAFLRREAVTTKPQHQTGYVIVKIGEEKISLGRGIAEKVEVQRKSNG